MDKAALMRSVAGRKAALDALRPLAPVAAAQLRKFYDIELTWTSNAIEGNTLTARETAEIVEHGLTVGGKRLREHLEAADHHDALQWVRALADDATPIDEGIVVELHRRIVARSQPEIAGVYATLPRRILGAPVVFPNPAKIPELMQAFGAHRTAASPGWPEAFAAHLKLVSIHPFADGNGRTARLLMNLILLRAGYPPIAVRPEDRTAYLDAIERAQTGRDETPYELLMLRRLDETLAEYLAALQAAP